jgi:Ca-activated chloride channel family protein
VDAVLTDWERLRKRTRVLVLLDVSKSMDARIKAAKDAARRGISRLGANDHVAVWGFPGGPTAATEKFAPFAGPGPRASAVDDVSIQGEGGSPLYEALAEADESVLDSRPASDEEEILAIVVLTDGNDNPPGRARRTPAARVAEIFARLKDRTRGTVHVFPIAIGDKVNTADLKNIADATGGVAYCLDTTADATADANCQRKDTDREVFDQIFVQLGGGPHQP